MKRNLSIVAAAAAVLVLMFGVYRVTQPTSAIISPEAAQQQLLDLGARFSAAIENERDVTPFLEPVRLIVVQRPELRSGRKLLGQVYVKLGKTQEAYEEFAVALTLDPADAQLQNLAGTAAMMIGDAASAETHHRLAVRLSPEEPKLLLPLADVLIKAKRWEEARGVLLLALEIQLTLHEASAGLSDVYAGRGQPGDGQLALDQMEKAINQLPQKPETAETRVIYTRKLARLFAEQGDAMEAIQVLDSLPESARFSPEVLATMAGYLEGNGQAALAGLQYELALDHQPTNADYAEQAARWYLKGGDASAAKAMLGKLKEISRHHPAIAELNKQISANP